MGTKQSNYFTLLVMFLVQFSFAQEKTITGIVTDGNTSPLSGASILVKGTNKGIVTNFDGEYVITASVGEILQFSYLGMITKEITIGDSNIINIILESNKNILEEIVIIGYGNQSRRNLTDNIATIKSEDIDNIPTPNVFNTITGKVAGVQVNQTSGKVDGGLNFRIRGQSSISAGTNPLYVLDGIPLINNNESSNDSPSNPLLTISPNEIESITIMKDASAAAIYGSRGANGVVVITTKRGKAGKTTFSVNFSSGISKPTNTIDFLNASQYVELYTEAAENVGELEDLEDVFDQFSGNTDWRNGEVDTDWQDLAFQNGFTRDADFSMSGGTAKTSFFFSGAYNDTKGIIKNNNLDRISARINIDHKFTKSFKVGMGLSYAKVRIDRIGNDDEFTTPMQGVIQLPITPAFLDNGDPNPNTFYDSFILHDKHSFFKTTVKTIIGKVFGEYKFSNSLKFNSDYAFESFIQSENSFIGRLAPSQSTNGEGFISNVDTENYVFTNYITFNNNFNDIHDLNIVGGIEVNESKSKRNSVTGTQFPSDDFQTIDNAAEITAGTGNVSAYSFLSYFVRATYALNDKYLFKASIRYDGSSRFGKKNQYGTFPAFSAGWLLSEEKFLIDSEMISFLKLRGSWGEVGNAEIGNFASRDLFSGTSYNRRPGIRPSQPGNPSLTWESSTQTDIGIEYGLFKGRIKGDIAYYIKDTDALLFEQPIVPSAGSSDNVTKNIGRLVSKGIEFSFETTNIQNQNFTWTTSFNLGQNKNKVEKLVGGNDVVSRATILRENEPVNAFYMYEYAGVDPANGDGLYYTNRDNGDGTIDRSTTNNPNEATRIVAGNPNPEWIGGLTNTIVYKNLDFSFAFQGEWGAEIFDGGKLFYSANASSIDNQTTDQLRRWQNPGDITDVPQARYDEANGTAISTRYLEKGDFIRLKNITLGYSLPEGVIKKVGLSKVRIYLTGFNLLTFTDYNGYDPESRTDVGDIGEAFYSPPSPKTYSTGVNVSF